MAIEVPPNMGIWQMRSKRGTQWGMRLAEFGFVQGLVQLLSGVAGLLIVRTLSKPEYTLYAIVNSMQTACSVLADIGIGIGVRSIGGRVWDNRARFGQLLNTALALRHRFAVVSLSVCLPVTTWMLWRNQASALEIFGLTTVVIVGVFPLLASSVFNVSAQLHGEYRRMQKLDFGSAALRLTLVGGLVASWMNAFLAVSVGAVCNWLNAFFYRRWAHSYADATAPVNEDDRRELVRLSRRWMPNVIFFCLQGQITLFILSLIGNATGIADVTALGRLAVLFTVVAVTFGSLLAPRFARCQNPARLPRLYCLMVGGTILVLAPLALVAWLFPDPFLWLLGGKYAALRSECGWVVAAGCVSQLCSVMWSLNSSKAWIRLQSVAFIPAILGAQIVTAYSLDLRLFHNVLIFNLIGSAAPLPVYVLDAYLGLKANSRFHSVRPAG
jgi:hypothetical protein